MSRSATRPSLAPLAVLLAAAGLLAGCTGSPEPAPTTSAPTSSATPTPSASPTTKPVPATLVATATEITVLDASGRTLLLLEYTDDADAAVADLTDLLGYTAIRTDVTDTGGGCSLDQSFYDFHGFSLEVPGGVTSQPGSTFAVELSATSAEGVRLETVDGQQVGVLVNDFLAAVPGSVLNGDYGGRQLVGFDVIDPSVEAYEQIGALAHGEDGVVTRFSMPYYVSGDC